MRTIVTDAEGNVKYTDTNALGQTVKEVDKGDPNETGEMTKQYEYDLNGNLTKEIRNDNTEVTYQYNSRNWMTRQEYSSTNYTTFAYDEAGNRTAMADVRNGGLPITSGWSYDALGRLTQVQQDGVTVDYAYDGSDNISQLSYQNGAETVNLNYEYDTFGRLQKIKRGNSTVEEEVYNENGDLDYAKEYRNFGAGGTEYTKREYTYDSTGAVIGITYWDGTVKREDHQITLDRRGYITQEDYYENYGTAKTVNKSYEYDGIGRVTQTVIGSKTTTYAYDKVGNRTSMNDGTNTHTYTYDQYYRLTVDKKDGVTDATYTYDARGNQTQEVAKKDNNGTIENQTTDYTYDLANRLTGTSAKFASETEPHMQTQDIYNGDGVRIRHTETDNTGPGVTTKYVYVGDALLFTADINNNKAEENIIDPGGRIVASKRFDGAYANQFYFYRYDIRGSVTNITDSTGAVVKGYEYDAYGNTIEKGDAQFKNSTKFTGAVQDKGTGLYYMNARHYNPSTGRFLQQDTVSGSAYQPWTQNLYAYCGNNPVNMIDPTGHSFFSNIFKAINAVISMVRKVVSTAAAVMKKTSSGKKSGGFSWFTGRWTSAKKKSSGESSRSSIFNIGYKDQTSDPEEYKTWAKDLNTALAHNEQQSNLMEQIENPNISSVKIRTTKHTVTEFEEWAIRTAWAAITWKIGGGGSSAGGASTPAGKAVGGAKATGSIGLGLLSAPTLPAGDYTKVEMIISTKDGRGFVSKRLYSYDFDPKHQVTDTNSYNLAKTNANGGVMTPMVGGGISVPYAQPWQKEDYDFYYH